MVSVGTESQPEEVALMRIVAETVIGKVGDLIAFQIQDRNGLTGLTLLRSISVVQRRGIAIIGTECNRGRKTIYRSDPARRGDIQPLAGWKWKVTRLSRIIR